MPATETTAPTRIERLCAEHGLRLTGQRRVIARILSAAQDHPDVEEVFRRAAAIEPGIALSTVYRTVKLFEDYGLLERHAFGGPQARARFEAASREHHDHLIDVETGQVIEFANAEIEALQERIAKELGFELVGHRLQLYGVRRIGKAQK
jgi:Fur family transcriptional regulator, ferric uptake regulator